MGRSDWAIVGFGYKYINMINRPDYAQREHNGVYAFDLKVNVDFNSGHMSLNVPNHAPFAKKNHQPAQLQ